MPVTKPKTWRPRANASRARLRAGSLGIGNRQPLQVVGLVKAGFPFTYLNDFQKATRLPWDRIARFVSIPQRTLTRRQGEGKLQAEESDRVWRAATVFDRAVELFEGDVDAAREWLLAPQRGLGGAVPLEVASTAVGAREVENLIGRLEDGII